MQTYSKCGLGISAE